MYRCTECHTEYTQCPDYCECGNNQFEEFVEQVYDEYDKEVYQAPTSRKRQLSQEEIEEIEEEKLDKKKALITIGISLFISLLIIVLPPYFPKKTNHLKKEKEVANIKIPDVNTYWDNTVASPFRKADPTANLPILNKHFSSISPVLREYLISVGAEFNRLWDPNLVDGAGECKVEFTINKEGGLNTKKIVIRSHNESLDDSVLYVLSKLTSFDVPPDDYKGERIIIAFKVDKYRTSKIYYPMK